MIEIWKWVDGYDETYQVSNLGRVCSFNGTMKKQSGSLGPRSRYKYVTLYKDNIGTKIAVHRLVALHFVPNPNNYPYVLHKKNDRSNNQATNLKWGTQTHNIADAKAHGTYRKPPRKLGTDQWNSKLTPAEVLKIREIQNSGVWISQERLAAKFGISRGTLRAVLKGTSWRHV